MANEIRKKYLEFFEEKGHKIIPSASVVPENDPTVLFTTAGMHPLVPYLMGEKHPKGNRLVNSQKCIRTGDIDEVGDNRHLTFFEMLGNWSLGNYFKKEAIEWSWEFLTDKKWLGLDPKRIYVTVFAGDEDVSRDEESVKLWKEQFKKAGIKADTCDEKEEIKENSRIFSLGKEDNWWGPAGETGPCGPDTEMFYKVDTNSELKGTFEEMVDSFKIMEVWNDVFMEYEKKIKIPLSPRWTDFTKGENGKDNEIPLSPPLGKGEDKKYEFVKLSQKNVDTGMGLERITTVLNGQENVFETELFLPIIEKIEEISSKKSDIADDSTKTHLNASLQKENKEAEEIKKSMRIIADHIKASVFIIADGIEPSNTGQGYVLRRLIRRAIREGKRLEINDNFISKIAKVVQEMYMDVYLEVNDEKILEVLNEEEDKFRGTLNRGLKKFDYWYKHAYTRGDKENLSDKLKKSPKRLSGKVIFDLYTTYGFPLELIREEAQNKGIIIDEEVDIKDFKERLKKHQELSRTASAGMFKGGLADNKEQTTQLHTVAHLMLAGLRKVLGDQIHQKGSNINGERIRFDFSHPEKMTDEEKKQVEDFVNEGIEKKIPVEMKEMSLEEAKESGAEGAFENKYGDRVKVYNIEGYSKEICGGPHVENTGDIKGKFKIKKEKSSSAGVRRIKAVCLPVD